MGVGAISENYPLLADAVNEGGLFFACLNYPNTCKYYDYDDSKSNIAPYELGLYLLSICKNVQEVKNKMNNINIIDINFSKKIINTPLHFMFGDSNGSIVIETKEDGLKLHDNLFNVLTNNPRF